MPEDHGRQVTAGQTLSHEAVAERLTKKLAEHDADVMHLCWTEAAVADLGRIADYILVYAAHPCTCLGQVNLRGA